MDVALLGGTGDIGEGLALQFAYHTDHGVLVGSREADRARDKADEYENELASRGRDRSVEGDENAAVADRADVVVLAVPPYYVADVVDDIVDCLEDTLLVNPAVGMERTETGFRYDPPPTGSVTELVADAAPDDVPVVGAYHSLPAARLANLGADFEMDTLLVGDDGDAKETITYLTQEVPGLRALDAGPLSNAAQVEALTPLLLTLKFHNKRLPDVAVRFG